MKLSKIVKTGIVAMLAGTMLTSLTGCGNGGANNSDKSTEATQEKSSGGESKKTEGITIKFQQWWGGELPEGYLQKICDDYEAATGNKVELLTAPWADTKTAITAGATNGTIADVLSIDGAWLAEFADMGILTDLSTVNVKLDLASDVWKVKNTDYVVPILNFAYPMYANMDILEKSGVEKIPATWTELEQACEKIKAAGYSAFALNLGTTNANGIQNVFMGTGWASGITLKDKDGKYVTKDNKELASLAEMYKKLYDSGVLYPGMSTLEEAEMTSNFAAGNCAFTVASAATMSQFEKLNFKAATIPVKDGYTDKSGICYASWAV